MTQPAREAPPDIVLLATDWQTRALTRAQLIEEGLEVAAADTWPAARRLLRPGMKPRLVIVDLQGLPGPENVLRDLKVLMKPDRVLVLTALGTLGPEEVARLGFPHVVSRPIAIADLVRAAAQYASWGCQIGPR